MKLLLLFTFFLGLTYVNGQNFAPFNDTVPKRFSNSTLPSDDGYFFYSQLNEVNGDTILFSQYFVLSDLEVDVTGTSCAGWGGGQQSVIDTTWFGRVIKYNNATNELILSNIELAQLRFDFGISLGDSSLFYQNAGNEYYIKYESIGTESIFGVIDFVKTFKVLHYDLMANPIASTLHNFEIKLGEDVGLIQFMNCYDFPQTEMGLKLKGQLNPTLGEYQMTYDEAFPWSIGDTLEYTGYNSPSFGGPTTIAYSRYVVNNRIETVDSVYIYFDYDLQVNNSPPGLSNYPPVYLIDYPNPFGYKKGENLIEQPGGMVEIQTTSYFSDSIESCGYKKRVGRVDAFELYCQECDCMIPYDGFGTALHFKDYQATKGITNMSQQLYGSAGYNPYSELIYSNIDGDICGNYVPLGINELELSIKIFPNPTTKELNISLPVQMISGIIKDAKGIEIDTFTIENLNFTRDVSKFSKGVYFLLVRNDHQSSTVRFIVE